jgi:hypothetical protein
MSTVGGKPRVAVLGIDGCPNLAPTRALVERIACELGLDPTIETIEVPDAESAAQLRFLGSPSVRVDGVDVEPGAEGRSEHVFACRVYGTPDGYAGQPREAWVRDGLRAAGEAGL